MSLVATRTIEKGAAESDRQIYMHQLGTFKLVFIGFYRKDLLVSTRQLTRTTYRIARLTFQIKYVRGMGMAIVPTNHIK
jgi:hypothetical protein